MKRLLRSICFWKKRDYSLDDVETVESLWKITQDYRFSMGEIGDMQLENPGNPLYIGVVSEEDFILRVDALRWINRGDFARAKTISEDGLSKNRDIPYLRYIRGKTHLHEGLWDDAICDFENAIQDFPDFYNAYLDLSIALFNRGLERMGWAKGRVLERESIKIEGDFSLARDKLLIAKKICPKKPGACDLLGRLYYYGGNLFQAKQNLEKALKNKTVCVDTENLLEKMKKT